jgi:hypothetical protein
MILSMKLNETSGPSRSTVARRTKLRTFALGILVRLAGIVLIILGDGHESWWARALVIAGVALSVFGIAVLRVLLMQPLLGKLRKDHG